MRRRIVSPLGEQVASAKEHFLRRIEELRRHVDYDYPPARLRELVSDVEQAEADYRETWLRSIP